MLNSIVDYYNVLFAVNIFNSYDFFALFTLLSVGNKFNLSKVCLMLGCQISKRMVLNNHYSQEM